MRDELEKLKEAARQLQRSDWMLFYDMVIKFPFLFEQVAPLLGYSKPRIFVPSNKVKKRSVRRGQQILSGEEVLTTAKVMASKGERIDSASLAHRIKHNHVEIPFKEIISRVYQHLYALSHEAKELEAIGVGADRYFRLRREPELLSDSQ
jgi:hypothetical protein